MHLIQPSPKIPAGRDQIHVCIPSRGRADRVLVTNAIDHAVLFVAESQAAEYRKHNPNNEIVVHPDDIELRYPIMKWQWMMDYYGGNVCFVDDDIDKMVNMTPAKRSVDLTPEQAWERIQVTGWAAKDTDCYMFGFNKSADPRNYNGLRPIRMSGCVWMCGMGILPGSKLFLQPEDDEGELFISLLNAFYYRKVFVDERFSFNEPANATYRDTGGSATTRNLEALRRSLEILQSSFGSDIVQLKSDVWRSKVRHQYQPKIVMPF